MQDSVTGHYSFWLLVGWSGDLDSRGGITLSVCMCVWSKRIKQRWLQSGELSWRCPASLQLLALKQQYEQRQCSISSGVFPSFAPSARLPTVFWLLTYTIANVWCHIVALNQSLGFTSTLCPNKLVCVTLQCLGPGDKAWTKTCWPESPLFILTVWLKISVGE